ncbi:ribosome small subunit-dependent GTPase A [Anaerovorax odorimutans]|uniref:ribosome small subunit-dependent GTPase A n=1 Tax=Anaerovorax odorimutans TaxID=109327 RepID=UPI0004069514|nr:ribosome small subunit-dependent GTPase A [Anaerovorax odorimutans]
MKKLELYGLNPRFEAESTLYPDFVLGRVISQYKDLYKVVTNEKELLAEISGKFRHQTNYISDYPAVGDFVMLDRINDENGNGIIHHVLTRKSSFERAAVGIKNETQIVAANIDIIFICMSLNNDYNLRRLERYLSIAWNSRATPVVILTKSDLCSILEEKLLEISKIAIGVDIIVTSNLEPESYEPLKKYLKYGITASFIGSSGVGKSTLINCLLGGNFLSTNEIRKDDKGKHTTTRKDLILLPDGGIVIDTPGMRQLGVDSVDLKKSFTDIDNLAKQCRFRNCTHTIEPGCAVKAAIDNESLDEKRLNNYIKLKKEARYDGLTSKQIEHEKLNDMFSSFGGIKNAKRIIKEKNKRKY